MKAPISWRRKKTHKVFKKVTIVFHEHSFHRRLRVIPRRQVTRARGEDRREKKWLLLESRFRAAIFFSCLSSFSLSSTKRQMRDCLYSTFIVASIVTLVVIIITGEMGWQVVETYALYQTMSLSIWGGRVRGSAQRQISPLLWVFPLIEKPIFDLL